MSSRRLSLDQLSDYRQLTAERNALWSKLAAAMTELSAANCTIAAADEMANALDAFHTANRALTLDEAQVVSVARALVRIEDALKAYRETRKEGEDGRSTTPHQKAP